MDFNVVDNMLLLVDKLKELQQAKEQGKISPKSAPSKRSAKRKKSKKGL